MTMKKILRVLCVASLLTLAACTMQPERAGKVMVPFDPAALGEPSHRVDSGNSWVRIYVYRAGMMSSLGHNHIVLARDIEGELWLQATPADSSFHLKLPVDAFIVDPPLLRAQAGADFATQPSASDIEGTRRNMLGEKVLNAAHYPFIEIWSERIRVSGGALTADIVVAARGTLRRLSIPVNFTATESELGASGKLTLKQTELGITPFSIMMGALAVRDELDIEYSITVESDSGIKDLLGLN